MARRRQYSSGCVSRRATGALVDAKCQRRTRREIIVSCHRRHAPYESAPPVQERQRVRISLGGLTRKARYQLRACSGGIGAAEAGGRRDKAHTSYISQQMPPQCAHFMVPGARLHVLDRGMGSGEQKSDAQLGE